MAFPTEFSITDQTYTSTTVVKFTIPSGISVSDHLVLIMGWDGTNAPQRETSLSFTHITSIAAGSQGLTLMSKIADGNESGKTLSFSINNNESIIRFMIYKGATGGVAFGTALSSSVSTKSMSLVTVAPSWGAGKDTLYVAGVLTAYNSASPTVTSFPAAFSRRRSLATNFEANGGVSFTTVEVSKSDTTTSPSGEWGIETAGSLLPFAYAVQGITAGVGITSVSADNEVYSQETDAAVVGTGLSASTSVTIKGIACTVVSASSSTSIKLNFPDFIANNIKVGTQASMLFDSTTFSVSVQPAQGWKFTVMSSPDISNTPSMAFGQTPTVVTGDIVVFSEWAYRNGATLSYSVTVSTDGHVTVFSGGDSASLHVKYLFWDESTSAYGTTANYSINAGSAGGIVATSDHNIFQWFYSQAYTGSLGVRIKKYLADQGYTGPFNSALFNWLRSLGYTGSLQNMINRFEREYTNRHG